MEFYAVTWTYLPIWLLTILWRYCDSQLTKYIYNIVIFEVNSIYDNLSSTRFPSLWQIYAVQWTFMFQVISFRRYRKYTISLLLFNIHICLNSQYSSTFFILLQPIRNDRRYRRRRHRQSCLDEWNKLYA